MFDIRLFVTSIGTLGAGSMAVIGGLGINKPFLENIYLLIGTPFLFCGIILIISFILIETKKEKQLPKEILYKIKQLGDKK